MISRSGRLNIICLIMTFCFCANETFSQEQSEVYDWPLKPGMAKWKDLTTHAQMLQVLQIPINKLQMMSTKSLAQTCLNYPLFPDIWAFNSLQDGMTHVITGFNGLQELLRRDNMGAELFKIYKMMNPHNFDQNWSLFEKGKYSAEFAKIEILMAQEEILSSLKQNERAMLLCEALNKKKAMQQYAIYDKKNQEPNTYLIGKILQKDNPIFNSEIFKQDEKIQAFLNQGFMVSKDTLEKIITIAYKYCDN